MYTQVDCQVDGWVDLSRQPEGWTNCCEQHLLLVPPPLQDCPGHSPAHPTEPIPAATSAREAPGRRKRSRHQRQLVEKADWAGHGMVEAAKFWEKKAFLGVSHHCILPPGRSCNFWVVPLRHHRTLQMRKFSEGHQNQRDCDTLRALMGDIHLSGMGKPPVGAGGSRGDEENCRTQGVSLVSLTWFSTQICHPELWVSTSRQMGHLPEYPAVLGCPALPALPHPSLPG